MTHFLFQSWPCRPLVADWYINDALAIIPFYFVIKNMAQTCFMVNIEERLVENSLLF